MESSSQTNQPNPDSAAEQIARLIQAIELSGKAVLTSTGDELLQSIVSIAARIFSAEAAALLLVDESDGTLVFRVEVGNKQPDLVGMRIPMDKGIAGYVAMTGQAIAVSNVQQDTRFNAEFARSTGYVPDSILAAPLLRDDRVIGVLEVLDKIEESSFGLQDMELMGLFAHQAGLAIRQAQQMEMVGDALQRGLRQLAEDGGLPDATLLIDALDGASRTPPEAEDLLALAGLFNDLSKLGPAERRAGLKILAALAEMGRTRTKSRTRFS
jgi:GAF domain-containing protein